MTGWLPPGIFLQGAILGTGIGAFAVGLVLVYRTTRILNFAHGATGTVAAGLAVALHSTQDLPWLWCVAVAVATGLLVGWVSEQLVVRRLGAANRLTASIATIGLAQLLGGLATRIPLWLGAFSEPGAFTTPLTRHGLTVGAVVITGDQLVAALAALTALGLVTGALYGTTYGTAARGIADNLDRARLLSLPTRQISSVIWVVAGGFAALTTVLAAPSVGVSSTAAATPQLLMPALAAAVLARLDRVPVAFAAGVGLGILDAAVRWNVRAQSVTDVVFLGVILVALAGRRTTPWPRGGSEDWEQPAPRPGPSAPLHEARIRLGGTTGWKGRPRTAARPSGVVSGVGLLALALLPLVLDQSNLNIASSAVVFAMVALSLVVLTGWGGTVSLGQFALAGVGGLIVANMLARGHADLFLALITGSAGAGLAALLIGLPSLRIKGIYLAVTTLAFAVVVDGYVLNTSDLPGLLPASFPRPLLWGRFDLVDEATFYELCLGCLAVVLFLVLGLRRSRPGRVLIAVRDNGAAAAAAGISVRGTKLAMFVTAGMIAGLAGGLEVVLLGGIAVHTFDPSLSLLVLAMAVIGGISSPGGALAGAGLITAANTLWPGYQSVFAGAGMFLILLALPRGLVPTGRTALADLRQRGLRSTLRTGPGTGASGAGPMKRTTGPVDEAIVAVSSQTTRNSGPDVPAPGGRRPGARAPGSARTGVGAGGRPDGPGRPPTATGPPVLSCRDLTASYGARQVLFGVSLEVAQGQSVALLGANGAGKSTVLRCLTGLLQPDGGEVRVAGLTGRHAHRRRRRERRLDPERLRRHGVALMPGGRGLFESLSVEDNLRLALWPLRRQPAAAETAYWAALGPFAALSSRSGARAGTLSGGEQQMLSLAMALAGEPRVLCIDELSLGLAPTVVGDLTRRVRAAHAAGATIVIVEQSVNLALELAEEAVFLDKGQVRYRGPTRDLLTRPDILRAAFLGTGRADVTTRAPMPRPSEARNGAPSAHAASAVAGRVPHARTAESARSSAAARDSDVPAAVHPTGGQLSCEGITKHYGGVVALDDLSLRIAPGEAVGLIGHNGAGKTTLLDVISGFALADAGRLAMDGRDLTHLPPHTRAVAGLGRSFQGARLFPTLTVSEALAVAYDRHLTSREPLAAALRLPISLDAEGTAGRRVAEVIALLGLEEWAGHPTSVLSTGTRRIVELGCAVMQQPRVLLLDEPSAGVAQRDVEALGPLLRDIRRATGATMLVIEHDVNLLSAVCDRLIALERGAIIAEGPPHEVLAHRRVIASYLGTDPAAIERSDKGARPRGRPAGRSTPQT